MTILTIIDYPYSLHGVFSLWSETNSFCHVCGRSSEYRKRVLGYEYRIIDEGSRCVRYSAPMEGHSQWAWPVPQYLSGVLLRWLCEEL